MIAVGGQKLAAYIGLRKIGRGYLGSTAIYTGVVVPGPAVDVQRSGMLLARKAPPSYLHAGRAGTLVTRRSTLRSDVHAGRAGILIARKNS